ncbi:MAG: hypothetical protein OEL76_12690 [Siculibacillus sp.]|nr:hypothetical protein [Siculibacillus sp.]
MWDWAVRALGVFWFAGGMITLRALHETRGLDGMIAALSGGVRRRDVVRAALLTLGAVLTALAGFLLAALDRFAQAALLANALVQAAWLFYAAREFPPEDDEDRIGRTRVSNAFGVWLVGTGLVIAAEQFDVVRFEALPVVEAVAGVAAVAALVWQAFEIRALRAMPGLDASPIAGQEPEPGPYRQPVNVILAPEVGCWPLWDADDGRNLDPSRLDLPEDLRERIADFEGRVIEALDVDHDDGPTIVDREALRRFEGEAIEITRALEAIYGEDAVAWKLPGEA